ncbi:Hint domain-containing protein, partial [Albidovulum sp.]
AMPRPGPAAFALAAFGLAAGAPVATPRGAVAAADLRPGDMVWTLDGGARPLRAVRLRCDASAGGASGGGSGAAMAVRIPAGLICNAGELWLSPGQRLVLSGIAAFDLLGSHEVLAAAGDLVGLGGIEPGRPARSGLVELVLDRAEILFADGARLAAAGADGADHDRTAGRHRPRLAGRPCLTAREARQIARHLFAAARSDGLRPCA